MRISLHNPKTLQEKFFSLNWVLILTICAIVFIGILVLYSAAGGSINRWAFPQLIRFGLGFSLMLAMALTDIRIWLKSAYAFYIISLVLLVFVEFKGHIGMGAQRWVDLGVIKLQPSEMMKVALIVTLARYFRNVTEHGLSDIRYFVPPLLLILLPVGLVMKQPDLGTALILLMSGFVLFFVAGLRWRYILGMVILAAGAIPIGWNFLHAYQKRRIMTLLNPESDPLGAGYHVMQSKIALGSGGLSGKGFLKGTQGALNFLPEKQTDFIFTMFCEEFGFVGGIFLLCMYCFLIIQGYIITLRCRHHFGRLLGVGIFTTMFLYVVINMGMVMGLLPVVGVPLPLISYGGTALLTLLMGFGFVLSADVHREPLHGKMENT